MNSSSRLKLSLTYVGGPTVRIRCGDFVFLTDPTFDPANSSYSNGLITLRKTQPPSVAAFDLGRIDAVLLSHDQHSDNFDASGRDFSRTVPQIVTTRSAASRLGANALGLSAWESTTFETSSGTLRVTATPARHGPLVLEKLAGEVVGFVLTHVESETDLLYVTGDTTWFRGVRDVSTIFDPKIVLVFAGAARTFIPFALTMTAKHVLKTAAAFANATLVPVHHEGWAHFSQNVDLLKKSFDEAGIVERLKILHPGTETTIEF